MQTTDIWIRDVDKRDLLPDKVRLTIKESVLQALPDYYKFFQFGYSTSWCDYLHKQHHYDMPLVDLSLMSTAVHFPTTTDTITTSTPLRKSKATMNTA